MSKLNLSRSELIFCGLLLLGAVGFGTERLRQAIYRAQEPQIFKDATRSVSPGETITFTYREIGQQCNFIPWNGTAEMTVQNVMLYPSYTAARVAGELVENPNGFLHHTDNPFLVIEVEVKNVDAEEGDYAWYPAEIKGISNSDNAITIEQMFYLYSDTPFSDQGQYLSSCIWCVDGISSSDYSASVDIPQGETVHITLGFSLEAGAEDHLDGASLIYESIFDRMGIGTPALGGETNAAISH